MQKINQVIVKALKLKTSRILTLNIKALQDQVLKENIFNAFSKQERVAI